MEWGIMFYEDANGAVPAEVFLEACPAKVDATFNAVLDAVRAHRRPPSPEVASGRRCTGRWPATTRSA
jgi:hypothetical protein